ncbi:hypothetical protein FIBSPDRAFT_896044 [Athelia psychrophila]|uniref:BOD1/SHG1 domain-containing protein n=1 Tax=Athelia psychrophila TaxID=1759441 RepID=A0A166DWP7_9AGAM|nr:hypothetical protein FIBSPDRAFT_896044 [Fibularhizoctonia sp. CBS 109695]
MPINTPSQLVEAYKKTGEFERLRRDLLSNFQSTPDGMNALMGRVEEKTRQKLGDQRLHLMPPDTVHRELLQELDRYPIVERALKESEVLSDTSLHEGVRKSFQKILREDRGPKGITQVQPEPQAHDGPSPFTLMRALHPDGNGMTPIHTSTGPAQSSIPEGPSAIRKALNSSNSQEEKSKSSPNSRSQSPDSMNMSSPSPEPPGSPVIANGIHLDFLTVQSVVTCNPKLLANRFRGGLATTPTGCDSMRPSHTYCLTAASSPVPISPPAM